MKTIRTEADFDDMLRHAKALAVVSAWNHHGLFAALAGGPKRVDELDAHPRGLATTIPVLKHLGLLAGDTEKVALTATAERMLAAGELPTARNFEWLAGLGEMGRVLKDGGPLNPDDATDGGVRVHDAERTATFLDMLYRRSEVPAQTCFEWLAPDLADDARVLDVGGGHGRYVRNFVDAGHHGTLYDFPHVIEYCKGRHGDRLDYLAGNFREDPSLGGPYDLILLSNIVHGEPAAENRKLLTALASTLNPGGRIVLKDMFIDAHGSHPENAVFFGLTMLYHTRAGQSPTVAEATAWLEEAGLAETQLLAFDRYQLLIGTKR